MRRVPWSVSELSQVIGAATRLTLNAPGRRVELELERSASAHLPIKRTKLGRAAEAVDAINRERGAGFRPSERVVAALFDMIDPQGR